MTLVDLDRPYVAEVVIDVETTGLDAPRIVELGGWSSRGPWASPERAQRTLEARA